jgi:hypothetical protein
LIPPDAALCVVCPNCARIDGPEQVGDPLLAGLTPLGGVLPNHAGADPQDIGAILFGAATGQDLGGQRLPEPVRVVRLLRPPA